MYVSETQLLVVDAVFVPTLFPSNAGKQDRILYTENGSLKVVLQNITTYYSIGGVA